MRAACNSNTNVPRWACSSKNNVAPNIPAHDVSLMELLLTVTAKECGLKVVADFKAPVECSLSTHAD